MYALVEMHSVTCFGYAETLKEVREEIMVLSRAFPDSYFTYLECDTENAI